MKNFMGKDGFTWFVGVVESRKDPKALGRLLVRCLGYHTEDRDKLPTSSLPWAHVMNPITSATISGVGQSPLGCVEGSWVVGFFTDGAAAQLPVIIGTLPGVPTTLPVKNGKGFQDFLNANYPKYKETDVNRLAVNVKDDPDDPVGAPWENPHVSDNLDVLYNPREGYEEINPHSSLTIRRADRDLAVGVAQIDGIYKGVAQIPTDLDITSWDEPATPYNAEYPRNHVYESEGGHIKEFDDTPGSERIHERHTSGSGFEIGPSGTKVTRVKGDNYELTTGDNYLHIQGVSRHTVDKGLRVRVNSKGEAGNNYNVEVGSGSNVNIEVNGGNINLTTLSSSEDAGDININCSRNLNMQVAGNMNIGVIGIITETSGRKTETTGIHESNAALHDINGNIINLN